MRGRPIRFAGHDGRLAPIDGSQALAGGVGSHRTRICRDDAFVKPLRARDVATLFGIGSIGQELVHITI